MKIKVPRMWYTKPTVTVINKSYNGQTSYRPVKLRINENIRHFKFKNSEKSRLVEHAFNENHSIKFKKSSIIC